MIKITDLIEWAQAHAIGRSTSFPEGWISGAALKNLGGAGFERRTSCIQQAGCWK